MASKSYTELNEYQAVLYDTTDYKLSNFQNIFIVRYSSPKGFVLYISNFENLKVLIQRFLVCLVPVERFSFRALRLTRFIVIIFYVQQRVKLRLLQAPM